MICDTCVSLDVFGQKGRDKFFNQCALLDVWNLEEGEECEYYKNAELARNAWTIMQAAAATYPSGPDGSPALCGGNGKNIVTKEHDMT